jgi:hypothetical protein
MELDTANDAPGPGSSRAAGVAARDRHQWLQNGVRDDLAGGVRCSDRVQFGDGVGGQGQGRAGDVLTQVIDR